MVRSMAENPAISVLGYQPAAARYRPAAWKTAVTVLSPWLFQSIVTAAVFVRNPDGITGKSWLLWAGMFLGVGFGCVLIVRSGLRLKAMWIAFYVPLQFICLLAVTLGVAMASGANE